MKSGATEREIYKQAVSEFNKCRTAIQQAMRSVIECVDTKDSLYDLVKTDKEILAAIDAMLMAALATRLSNISVGGRKGKI